MVQQRRGLGQAGTSRRTHYSHLHQHLPHGWEKGGPRSHCPQPPTHKTGHFQVVSKSPSGDIPQRRRGMGRDGPEDAAGQAGTVPRPLGCCSRALPVPGPACCSPATVPGQAAPWCQAPPRPARGDPRVSVALSQGTMAPLSEQLTLTRGRERQRTQQPLKTILMLFYN